MTYQAVLVPGDALLLVGVGVGVALDLAGLATEKTVQHGADLVALALLQGVALGATGLQGVRIVRPGSATTPSRRRD